MALVNNDIKRVLAFSTMSQLGYMVMAIGLAPFTAATFHLGTHAFFKALLFLGAGSVIHCVGSNDMALMGGLRKYMPVTTWTFIIGSLALAGIFPFAGFWSKDEIITTAFTSGHYGYFVIAEIVAFMTAFYMFRLIFRTFFGENHTPHGHLHESPKVMTVPLIILSVFAIFAGFVGAPFMHNGYASYVFYGEPHHPEANYFVMLLSTVLALAGIGLAYLMYHKKSIDQPRSPNPAVQSMAFSPTDSTSTRSISGSSTSSSWASLMSANGSIPTPSTVSSIASPTSPNGWRQTAQD